MLMTLPLRVDVDVDVDADRALSGVTDARRVDADDAAADAPCTAPAVTLDALLAAGLLLRISTLAGAPPCLEDSAAAAAAAALVSELAKSVVCLAVEVLVRLRVVLALPGLEAMSSLRLRT